MVLLGDPDCCLLYFVFLARRWLEMPLLLPPVNTMPVFVAALPLTGIVYVLFPIVGC